jgi:hypothetical protein
VSRGFITTARVFFSFIIKIKKVTAMKTEDQTEGTEQVQDGEEGVVSTLKPFLLGIAGLVIVMGILVLLPMLFTYFSSGDARAPSQIHHADPLGKKDSTAYKTL